MKEGEGESKGVTDRFLPFSLYPIQIFMQTIQTPISEYQLKTLNKVPFNTHTHTQQCNTKSPKEAFNALQITVHIAKLIFFPCTVSSITEVQTKPVPVSGISSP